MSFISLSAMGFGTNATGLALCASGGSDGFNTLAIHAGWTPDPNTGEVIPPISRSATFAQHEPGVPVGLDEYARASNPTRRVLEQRLATLEGANHAVAVASGLAATTLIMHSLPNNSRVLVGDDVYGGTYRLTATAFRDIHQFRYLDTTSLSTVEAMMTEFRPNLVWVESPTNPLLQITDIAGVAVLCRKCRALLLVDNTFSSPFLQNPLKLGADFVFHSTTKYINGHSDAIGGVVMLNDDEVHGQLQMLQNTLGLNLDAYPAWLTLRGVSTLGIRMERHQDNAQSVAEMLETHPEVERVIYPGLTSHPQHELAKSQMSGFGGMVTFFVKGGLERATVFLTGLRVFTLAESLGGIESLANHPARMTHASIPEARRGELGITDNLIRLSVGIEDEKDLIADLEQAFAGSRA